MKKMSMEALNRLSPEAFGEAEKLPVVLVLDNIRSGLNIGSVFRTSDAFAIRSVFLCGITATPPHREILKTALGSTETVTWSYWEHARDLVEHLKQAGYQVYAVEQTTEKTWLQDLDLQQGQQYAFVLGNEVDGVSEAVLEVCDGAVEIPQFGTKHSLNVAVAAGILLWEVTRNLRL
ncbi:MAG: TrmH family RNA methyltransferase [Bacteroidetes bacterium]|nr:MAG: TrmH family RNA methyltransferase [Bacteroidota bacterium]